MIPSAYRPVILKFLTDNKGKDNSMESLTDALVAKLESFEEFAELIAGNREFAQFPIPARQETGLIITGTSINGKVDTATAVKKLTGAYMLPQVDISERMDPGTKGGIVKNFTVDTLYSWYSENLPPSIRVQVPGAAQPFVLQRTMRRPSEGMGDFVKIFYTMPGMDEEVHGAKAVVSVSDELCSVDRVIEAVTAAAKSILSATPVSTIQPRMPAPVGSLDEALRLGIGDETDRNTSPEDMQNWKDAVAAGHRSLR